MGFSASFARLRCAIAVCRYRFVWRGDQSLQLLTKTKSLESTSIDKYTKTLHADAGWIIATWIKTIIATTLRTLK